MAFYRIYRPQVFEQIDNLEVQKTLTSLLTKDTHELPHAFLFSGSRGTGKTTSGRLIAKLFNCTKRTKSHGPCGVCEQCKTIGSGSNLDVLEIDAASNRGIDEIRLLRERIGLTPSLAQYTVYIIDEVHMLTTEAFNALLKTLEEPPKHAVFVLATTDPGKVPLTIRSRCLHIQFRQASVEELSSAVMRVAKKEKIDIDSDAVALIARYADGSFRDAVKFLEQVSFTKGKITRDVAMSLLALTDESNVELLLAHIQKKDIKQALNLIEQLSAAGTDIKQFIVDCLKKFEKLLMSVALGQDPHNSWTKAELRAAIGEFNNAYATLRVTPIVQLPLELAVITLCESPQSVATTGAVVQAKSKQDDPTLEDPKEVTSIQLGLITLEKLTEHWKDVIDEVKPLNHSLAGIMRSTRPKGVESGIVTIEAFYQFHKEKLAEIQAREVISNVLKKLFGERVKIDVQLGKK